MEKEELAPHSNANAQAEVCSKCGKNEWGSDPRPNSRGKACKEIRRLAVIPFTDQLTPENVAETEMAIIKLPVTSVKNWSNYVNKVGASLKRPPWSVITQIKVEPSQKNQFTVLFDCGGAVDAEFLQALNEKRESVLPALTAPYDPPTEGTEEVSESEKY